MKIVKSFLDKDYFNSIYNGALLDNDNCWFWGLGEDGKLYLKSSTYPNKNRWYKIIETSVQITDIKVIIRIAKEFGHLVSFL